MIYSVKYTKIACSLFHVITASRRVVHDWRTLLVVPSTSNARISLPGWSRYVSGARLDFLVGFRCKMVFDASTLWQVRGAMHTMSISSPLKDYTLSSTDITTLTKQRDDTLQDRCTRIHMHIYPILSRPRVRKMHFKEIFMRLATYVVWRRCTSLIFKKKNVLFETRCIVKFTEQIQKRVLDNITFRSFILFIRLSSSIVTISTEIQRLRVNATRILSAKQKDTIELEKRTDDILRYILTSTWSDLFQSPTDASVYRETYILYETLANRAAAEIKMEQPGSISSLLMLISGLIQK